MSSHDVSPDELSTDALIDARTMLAAQQQVLELGLDTRAEELAAAGIEVSGAERLAALVADAYPTVVGIDRGAIADAFLAGLGLGARSARLAR